MAILLDLVKSVRAGNLKTIAPIDLIFTQEGVYPWLGHPLR